MFGCFTLCIAAPFCVTLFISFPKQVFSIQGSPEPVHLYIEAGTELQLNCNVSDAENIGNLTAGDVVWHRSSSPLSSTLYSAVNDTLSRLSFNVTFDDSGDYSCMLPGNTTDELATYVVHVGLKPRPVRLQCIVRKPDDFYWCRWEETVNTHLPTVHTFQYKRKGRPWKSCPDLLSKGNNTCFITQTQNEGNRQIVRVRSSNQLGNSLSIKGFWSDQDVVVNPPRLVALRPGTDETSLKIRWNRPEGWYATEAKRLVVYNIRFKERDCVAVNLTCCCWDEIQPTCTQSVGEEYTEELGLCLHTLRYLEPYTEYTVQVAARYKDSPYWSAWTVENSSFTRETVPSEPVQGLTVFNQTDNAADPVYKRDVYVAWECLEAEYQNGPILDYQVSAEPLENTDDIGILKLVSNETACILKGLRKYSSYNIHVKARNSAGMGPETTKSIADRTTAPNAPDEVTAVPMTTTSILVTWKEPSRPNGYILCYIVQWRKSNTNGQMEQYTTHNASNRSHVLEGLETYALYEISVKANNSRGSGGAAYVHRGARTLQGVPNAAPSSLKVKPVSNLPESLMLTWESLPVANIQGILKGYLISYCKMNISGCSVLHHNLTRPDQTTFTLTGLSPSTNYTVGIAAYTEVGIGPDSDYVTAVTGERSFGIYLAAILLLVIALLFATVIGLFMFCIRRRYFDRLFRPSPCPKFSKNVHLFNNGTDLRRLNSRVEEEQFDEIATEVIAGKFQTTNQLNLPDIHIQKFIRTESGDSGIPPSPASDTLDFDAIRDKSGVTSEGEDSVFLGEDQAEEAAVISLPLEKLTVRIGRVEEGATHHFPRGATSPSSPIESVGSYTQVGEFPCSVKKSSTLKSTINVSDVPEVGPALTIEKPSEAKENDFQTQSEVLTTPGNNPLEASEDVSHSNNLQNSPIGPIQLTCPETDSIVIRRSSPLHNAEASVNTRPSLPTTSTSPVSPYVTTFETQKFLYPCKQENVHSRHLISSMGSVIGCSNRPNPSIFPVASTCNTKEQISGSTSDCRRDCLNPTPPLTSSSCSSEVDKTQPVFRDGYTPMSAIGDPRQQKSSTLEQSHVGMADSVRITQLAQPSQCSSLLKLEGNKPRSSSTYTRVSPVHVSIQHDTLKGTDKYRISMTDSDGFKAPNSQSSSSSADQHTPRPLTSTTHSSPSQLVLPYVKIESLRITPQTNLNDDLRLTMLSSQSRDVPSQQQLHVINSSHIHVAASEHPVRERGDQHEEPLEDIEMRKSIPHQSDTSRFGDKTEIATISSSVLTPSGYVQASVARSKQPAVNTQQLPVDQIIVQNTSTNAPTHSPDTNCTSDPEDDVQDYWKVSGPVSVPGSVLARLQAHSNTTSFSSDPDISDYTRTGRGTTSPSQAQTSVGYVQ